MYFDAVVGLIFFLLIGRVLEQIMHQRSGDRGGEFASVFVCGCAARDSGRDSPN